MRRVIWHFVVMVFLAAGARGQSALEFFTNQANALLQAQFGIGVTNIPVYCTTNPAVGYSASIHYQLQSAANAYDATTPATNLPSVFRPLFSWEGETLFIIGYACVTNDFHAQTASGFKNLTDPTITTNDNVWGIPWVIGAKGEIPAFNEYCYSSQVNVERELEFVRRPTGTPGQYFTTLPLEYTNQFYIMSISNIFGAEAWNFYSSAFTNRVTIVMSDQISITLTNNYNFGTNMVFSSTTNWSDAFSWQSGKFDIPLSMNTILLPLSYWSESTEDFVPLRSGDLSFLSSDLQQTGWPIHYWALNITNNLMYALIDNETGRVLDFVNLGAFGSSLNIMQALMSLPEAFDVWTVTPATDASNSPMSDGALTEIESGMAASPQFYYSLSGLPGGYPATVGSFTAPAYYLQDGQLPAGSASLIQSCSWQTANPMVHYTLGDLTNPRFNENIQSVPGPALLVALAESMSNSVCTLGKINPDYNSGAVEDFNFDLSDGLFQMGFSGAIDLPYQVWASTNLIDWSQIGTATQPAPGYFQFEDPAIADYSTRFYQARLP